MLRRKNWIHRCVTRLILIATLAPLFFGSTVPQVKAVGVLSDFFYAPSSFDASATTDYIFSFVTETELAVGDMVLRAAFPAGFDVDGTSVTVTIDDAPAAVGEYFDGDGSGYIYIRMTDIVPADSLVFITLSDVVNPTDVGYYPFDVLYTADSGASPVDEPAFIDTLPIGNPEAVFEGGAGTVEDPYQIGSCTQLQSMNQDLEAVYELVDDIDCSATAYWNNSDGFEPVGNGDSSFTGTFMGNGYTIEGLTVNRPTLQAAGLFGRASDATIRNVVLRNVSVVGQYNAGALIGAQSGGTVTYAGVNSGLIEAVEADSGNAGGLIGQTLSGAVVSDAYAVSVDAVTDGGIAGGLIGWLSVGSDSVSRSYATGEATGLFQGGFVGYANGDVTDCFFDTNTSGITDDYATGKTTEEMQDSDTFTDAGWDFVTVWDIDVFTNDAYPFIIWEEPISFDGGDGSNESPYRISNCEQLQAMAQDLAAEYVLNGDVDCAESSTWNEGVGFIPIGTFDDPFTGVLDGDDYSITDFYSATESDYAGLFGYVSGGTVMHVALSGTVAGDMYTGGVIGYALDAHVNDVTSDVTVTGGESVGGLVGYASGSFEIEFSQASGDVTGTGSAVGGLIGTLAGETQGVIYVSHSSSSDQTVTGTSNLGGLIGYISTGGVADCYSQSTVVQLDPGNQMGGLVGGASFATIQRTYASGTLAPIGSESIAGLVGGVFFTSSISDSFSAATGESLDIQGLYGSYSLGDPEDFTLDNNFYDVPRSGSGTCTAESAESIDNCTAISPGESADYWKTASNAPIDVWDTVSVWNLEGESDYPLLFAEGDIDVFSGDGSGTDEDPYLITSCEQIQEVNEDLDAVYEVDPSLEEDGLDCTADGNDIMIGEDGDQFTGSFHGNDVVITISIESDESTVGLFRDVRTAIISQVRVAGSVVGVGDVGGLAGTINDSLVDHVVSTVDVTGSDDDVGGLVGSFEQGKIEDSYVEGNVTVTGGSDTEDTGGFAGYIGEYAIVDSCYATGGVISSEGIDVGGFAGDIEEATVTRSYSTNIVNGTGYVGGFAGDVDDGAVISQSWSSGPVTGTDDHVGGFIGDIDYTAFVNNSFAHSAVIGVNDVGGFVGRAVGATLENVYAKGSVTGETNVHGLVGLNEEENSVSGSFWDIETSGTEEEGLGEGQSTAAMTDDSIFRDANWNFESVWGQSVFINDGYPYLLVETDNLDPDVVMQASPEETILEENQFQGEGVAQDLHDDDAYLTYELPFTFSFYGEDYTTAYVSTNGYLGFVDDEIMDDFSINIEHGIGVPIIAALSKDLRTDCEEREEDDIYVTEEETQVTFRWQAADYNTCEIEVNFEIVLRDDGSFSLNYGEQIGEFVTPIYVGVSNGARSYVLSDYDRVTSVDGLNTSAWEPAVEEPEPEATPRRSSGGSARPKTSFDPTSKTKEDADTTPTTTTGISPFDGSVEDITPVEAGMFIRAEHYDTVYYITSDLERRPLLNAQIYFTWEDSFDAIHWVTDATLVGLTLGDPLLPKSGVILVKIQSDPNVYALSGEDESTLRLIPNEETAVALYGADWAEYVIDLPPTLFSRFEKGEEMKTEDSVDRANMKTRQEIASEN